MANLYGVANAQGNFTGVGLAGDVACPANAETNIFTTAALTAPSNGYFTPVAGGWFVVTLGATPPTTLNISLRIGSGSDIAQLQMNPVFLVASANVLCPLSLFGTPSQVPWQGAGSTLSVSVNPLGQAVTARQVGGGVFFGLLRAPDQ